MGTPRVYGWKRDRHDSRDHKFSISHVNAAILPVVSSLRKLFPPVFDQTTLGSCTGNSIAGGYEYVMTKEHLRVFRPARLFIYYNERWMEGTISEDAGAEIRDGIKSLNIYGVCPEYQWPYIVERFAMKPPQQCYDTAKLHKCVSYARVPQDLVHLKTVLAVLKQPVIFGFTVFTSFESDAVAQTGNMPMPAHGETEEGGHAVCAVGFDDNHVNADGSKGAVEVRNSWGPDWGDAGHFWMPYSYFLNTNWVSDIWTLAVVQ